ncbi:hypothetical protein [Spirosoma koreense]
MHTIIDTIESPDWVIQGWQVKFILSEKQLHQIRKLSRVENWYEDPVIAATEMHKLNICFTSIRKFYEVFGTLPQIGDRLFNEDSGMVVQARSIDGSVDTITYVLSV